MENTNKHKYINLQERVGGFIYIMLLFCIGVGLCSWSLLSHNDTSSIFLHKSTFISKMGRQSEFRRIQERYVSVADSLFNRIGRYNTGINAIYEDNDIKYIINDLIQQYEKNTWDKRYQLFYNLGNIYEMWFTDKKILQSKKENVEFLRQNLEECESGY